MRILVAEDEKDIRELIELHLMEEGFEVLKAEDGMEALRLFEMKSVDLVILDVMMPKLDGFNTARKIREASEVPIVFLTARGDDMDKVLGFGLGADDYIVKPFSPVELIARIQAHLRRYRKYSSIPIKNEIVVGRLRLNKEGCALFKDGEAITLNAKEYKIMELLMANAGRVYTKKQLYELVWDDAFYSDDNTVMVHISYLRDKIEDDPKNPVFLKTIRGIGYKLEKG
ncbi:MAG: response regulator transcription factor [Clostridia bacterium]|nr:response regulator transcription factor [Clostridia bacterium]